MFIDENLTSWNYQYRLKQIDFDSNFKYSDIFGTGLIAVNNYKLWQNYPNPFNPATTISYQIPTKEFVIIKIFDEIGNEISTLVKETKDAGIHEVNFDASELSSGIYVYKIDAGKFHMSKKMLLLK